MADQMGCVGKAPATSAVVWEERTFVLGDRIQEKSKYSGKPSPAVDLAWHDLLNGMSTRHQGQVRFLFGKKAGLLIASLLR